MFQHRCQDKWRFGGNRFVDSLANEQFCFDLVKELSTKWSGRLWCNEKPTASEQATIDSLTGRRALYRRVGYDERVIQLDESQMVGEGSAECERLWNVNEVDSQPVLTLSRMDRPTCHLRRDNEGVWRGAWLEHEQMPIELIPYAAWIPTTEHISPHKPRLVITIAIGEAFAKLLELTGPILQRYAADCEADFVALTNTTQQWWGLEKFRIQQFAQAYERTLYVDADVILRDSAPNLFEFVKPGRVAMHDDWLHLPSYDWLFAERKAILESQNQPMDFLETTWNTGLVLCDREHASIWDPPTKPFLRSHCAEQLWIENNARQFAFFRLPTELNTQYWMPRFDELLPKAKIVHLANCPNDKRIELAKRFIESSSLIYH